LARNIAKKLDVNDLILTSILSLHYLVKFNSHILAVYNSKFKPDSTCSRCSKTGFRLSAKPPLWISWESLTYDARHILSEPATGSTGYLPFSSLSRRRQ